MCVCVCVCVCVCSVKVYVYTNTHTHTAVTKVANREFVVNSRIVAVIDWEASE